jgi:hypothetical protein
VIVDNSVPSDKIDRGGRLGYIGLLIHQTKDQCSVLAQTVISPVLHQILIQGLHDYEVAPSVT